MNLSKQAFMQICLKKGAVSVKKAKGETTHISANVASDIARAARIQAITEGVSLQEWISQAIRMQLEKSSTDYQTLAVQHGKQAVME
jgi:predicted HicB family RNase H-like nuclease